MTRKKNSDHQIQQFHWPETVNSVIHTTLMVPCYHSQCFSKILTNLVNLITHLIITSLKITKAKKNIKTTKSNNFVGHNNYFLGTSTHNDDGNHKKTKEQNGRTHIQEDK